MLESFINKFSGLKAWNFIKKRLQHGCFPLNIAKFLRTPILKNICERLLFYLLLSPIPQLKLTTNHRCIRSKFRGENCILYQYMNRVLRDINEVLDPLAI